MNAFDEYDEFDGLYPSELRDLKSLWSGLIDFAYSPYEPCLDEMHFIMQRMGKLLGDFPPEVLPFSGTAEKGSD